MLGPQWCPLPIYYVNNVIYKSHLWLTCTQQTTYYISTDSPRRTYDDLMVLRINRVGQSILFDKKTVSLDRQNATMKFLCYKCGLRQIWVCARRCSRRWWDYGYQECHRKYMVLLEFLLAGSQPLTHLSRSKVPEPLAVVASSAKLKFESGPKWKSPREQTS